MLNFIGFAGDLQFIGEDDVTASIVLSNASIGEGASIGDLIGTLSVLNGSGSYSFEIVDDGDGRAAVDGSDLEVAGVLDFVADPSFDVTIEANNGVDDVLSETFTITVLEGTGLTPGAIADLTAEFVGEDIQFTTAGATDAVSYQFRYRVTGETDWTAWQAVGGPFEGPQNTSHDFQIRGVGAGGKKGPASNTATATTPYYQPQEINDLVVAVTATLPPTVSLTYTASEDAVTHQAQYREAGETDWVDGGVVTNSLILPFNAQDYEIQVRGVNPSFNGDWSNLEEVTTSTPADFSDDFNQANKNLSAATGWAKDRGTDVDVQIVSNAVQTGNSGGNSATVIHCSNLYLRNTFIQIKTTNTSSSRWAGHFKDGGDGTGNNSISLRLPTALVTVTVRVAGASNVRISIADTHANNDLWRLEYLDGGLTLKKNGASVATYTLDAAELAALKDFTRAGIGNNTQSLSAGCDDFLHGAV